MGRPKAGYFSRPQVHIPPYFAFELDTVEALICGTARPYGMTPGFNYSLLDQVGKLLAIENRKLVPAVDVIGFTIRSAVPMAEVVRGLFQQLRIETPLLVAIPSGNLVRRQLYRDKAFRNSTIDALHPLVKNKDVAVIDELTASGDSLREAMALAYAATARDVQPVWGAWYKDLGEGGFILDIEKLRCETPHDPGRLRRIGAHCAELFLNQ